VTTRVCENIAQILAKPIFVKNDTYIAFLWEKVAKIFGYFGNFQKTSHVKQSPNK
jgi:hypothetical protein